MQADEESSKDAPLQTDNNQPGNVSNAQQQVAGLPTQQYVMSGPRPVLSQVPGSQSPGFLPRSPPGMMMHSPPGVLLQSHIFSLASPGLLVRPSAQSPAMNPLQRQLSNPVGMLGPGSPLQNYTQGYTSPSSSGHGSAMYQELQRPPAYPGSALHHNPSQQSNGTPLITAPGIPHTVTKHRKPSGEVYANIDNIPTPVNSNPPCRNEKSPRKRIKSEHKLHGPDKKEFITEHRKRKFIKLKENYVEHLTEYFFLQNSGNLMDYQAWKKKATPQLIDFLKTSKLDDRDKKSVLQQLKLVSEARPSTPTLILSSGIPSAVSAINQQLIEVKREPTESSVNLPPPYVISVPTINKAGPVGIRTIVPRLPKSPLSPQRLQTRQHSLAAVYDSTVGSQEAIVERAKQEAQVLQRIAELRKEGLWSSKRLPKVQEPPRHKAHWDYLLEEMTWLAADFAQERKWKRAACRKIANMVAKYHKEREQKVQRAEKEESLRLKRVASSMAKQIKEFWSNIEKVVQFKQTSRLEEKRKKALDLHLNFIVDQTEKYSTWLTEGLSKPGSVVSGSLSYTTSPAASDDEFKPDQDDTDDEETIEKEEKEVVDEEGQRAEIEALHKESEMPIEDLLKSLPKDILDNSANECEDEVCLVEPHITEQDEKEGNDDDEFVESDEDDVEETIDEQEQHEDTDHQQEIQELEAEGDLDIEELYKRYAGAYDEDFEFPKSDEDEDDSEESEEEEESEIEDEETEEEDVEMTDEEKEEIEDIGMEYLLHPEKEEETILQKSTSDASHGPGREITDIAATAQSLQPTGYTLETTKVKVPIPFLLKHTLREYQYVGLDWLATMYDKKLNGILADEMGLGKTIQTIALLAHLACEHGVWGPHLIVVPTSVMLNWEMELKKWCPAFKILTYYGTQKERKQKRTGWTKTNAFHVCITSYKLVIQDHQSFRRKKWKYFILDEAQNIKNFKSQRWQTLLNFSSMRRLLLTGTPLQNNLMELWSLMHFLMPHVFQSHREFKEWFANPLTGMVEGSQEYNENLIKRLHKVLRPFLLRRLKADVEKQMPKKYEHVVMCRLSKRQRFLYDDFMSKRQTKDTLATGHFMSVINILMQLRKVCNHPNLFDPRPITSPFQMEGIEFHTASIVLKALGYDPLKHVQLQSIHPGLANLELNLSAYAGHRVRNLSVPRKLIEEIDSAPLPPQRPRPVKLKFRTASPQVQTSGRSSPFVPIQQRASSPLIRSPLVRSPALSQPLSASQVLSQMRASGTSPVIIPTSINTTQVENLPGYVGIPRSSTPQGIMYTAALTSSTSSPITVQIHQTAAGTRLLIPSGQLSQLPAGLIQIVQTSNGQQILTTPSQVAALQQAAARVAASTSTAASLRPSTTIATTSSNTTTVAPTRTVSTTTSSIITPLVNGPSSLSTSSPSPSSSSVSTATHNTTIAVSSSAVISSSSLLQAIASTRILTSSTNTTASVLQNIVSPTVAGRTTPVPGVVPIVNKTNIASLPTRTVPVVTLPTSTPGTFNKPMVRVPPLVNASNVEAGTTTLKALNAVLRNTSDGGTTTNTADKPVLTRSATNVVRVEKKIKSKLHSEYLEKKRKEHRTETLNRITRLNKRRCELKPVYGEDLSQAVNLLHDIKHTKVQDNTWHGMGIVSCYNVHNHPRPVDPSVYWRQTNALAAIIHRPMDYMDELKEILEKYVFVTPPVMAPLITLHASHPPPSFINLERRREQLVHTHMSPRANCLHRISTNVTVQFPEARLIQYDCGKLQTMDILLRKLKSGSHRVLVFTQMTKMLDVLEAFLNYHGYRYLRLDGTTKVEQRQALMDRFNVDNRIFVFILSTRSGGLGVNLTGADTVIFYDSDWNPTMDAQAQDRCHRIGQTRDVHIYRLISENTVEENILKKANQKRLLGDVAIEGGNFTTAFFKQNTIKELFDKPSGLKELEDDSKSKEEVKETVTEITEDVKEKVAYATTKGVEAEVVPEISSSQLEQALGGAEDDTDVQAARVAVAEQKAELVEFDENVPWDEKEAESRKVEEDSKLEMELAQLEKELMPIERYAVSFLELMIEPFNTEELKLAEKQVEIAKQDWELGRLKALKEEEEFRAEIEEDEMLYTYSQEDTQNQVFIDDRTAEHMPMWSPPTPPHDESDIYIDRTMCFQYEPSTMTETQLPPFYIKKEPKRLRSDSGIRKHKHIRKEDHARVPRSLFDRPTAALLKMKREQKIMRLKQGLIKQPMRAMPTLPLKPPIDIAQDQPEWLIHEDWALLQAVQTLLELPLSLMVMSPAHTPNWDLVADVVNASSRVYRSPKQCKNRFENVVVPREEGKILYDVNPRKQKIKKSIYKTKNNRPMRTSQLFVQDQHNTTTTLHSLRFDSVKSLATKRPATLRPVLQNPQLKNPKHAAVLAESNINYEQPLSPVRVASIRAERIAREKQKSQAAAVVAAEQATQRSQQPVTAAAQHVVATTVPAGIVPALQGHLQQVSGITVPSTTILTITGTLPSAIRGQQTTPMTVQEISTLVASRQQAVARAVAQQQATGIPQVITSGSLTAGALLASPRLAISTAAGTAATVQQQLSTKQLTPQQLQVLRQHQALLKQQQIKQQAQRLQQAQSLQTVAKSRPLSQAEQLKQQQIKRAQLVQAHQMAAQVQQSAARQKTVAVSAPLVTSLAQAPLVTQKLQAVKSTPSTPQKQLTEAEIQAIIKKQKDLSTAQQQQKQLIQQQQLSAGTVQPLQTAVISQGQIIHQVSSATTSSQVATLVKTVSAVPSTIPASGVNLNVSVPQQKATGAAKATTVAAIGNISAQQQQQIRQIQLQRLQQQRQAQLQPAAKVQSVALTQQQIQQLQKSSLGPVQIIQQQGSSKIGQHTLQQIQHIMKQQAAGHQGASIQQIITAPHSNATLITSQHLVVTQAPTTPSVTRVTHLTPAGHSPARTVATNRALPLSLSTPTLHQTAAPTTITVVGNTVSAANASLTAASSTTLSSVQKIASITSGGVSSMGTALQRMSTPIILADHSPAKQAATVVAQLSKPPVTLNQSHISALTAASAASTVPIAVVATSAPPAIVTTVVSTTTANEQPATTLAQQTQQDQTKSPYTMRLRNPPKHQ